MAGRPTSGITAGTDVNLDFLTKEEKEALLSKKMDMIRQRNRMISERHELIEADRRKAEESGNAVKAMDSKTLPAEGVPNKPRGRGRGQSQGQSQGQGSSHRDGPRPSKDRPKSHGDTSSYEPIVDVSDFTVNRTVDNNHRDRGHNSNNNRGNNKGGYQQQQQHHPHPQHQQQQQHQPQHHYQQDRDVPTSTPKNRRKPHHQKDEAGFRQPPHSTVSKPTPTVAFDYEPIVDINDLDQRFGTRAFSSSQLPPSSSSTMQAASTVSRQTKQTDGNNNRGYHTGGHARSNRRSDPPDMNRSKSKPYDGRLKDSNPPPDPSFNPLSDWRRERGSDKREGGQQERPERSDRPDRSDQKRHPRNYGGGADLAKVKDNMKTMREREKERPMQSRNLEMVMTGRERKNHEQWKQERDRYDNERIQRQMGDTGGWKREWDNDKFVMDYEDQHHSKMEPAKRPAGRIGSGRFDRGDSREDHPPKTVSRDGKGGPPQQSHHHQHPQHQQPHQQQQQQQQQQYQAPPSSHHQHAPLSPRPTSAQPLLPQPQQLQQQQQQQQQMQGAPPPRAGRGRGRGRGRARGVGQGGQGQSPGVEKSQRPRTWSGGDDRFVDCQKEMLVVKFDNTVGDNSVEVEYDDAEPLSPTPSSKSSGSTPGRGPTGRTHNQGGSPSKSRGSRQQQQQQYQQQQQQHQHQQQQSSNQNHQQKSTRGKSGGSGRISSSSSSAHQSHHHQPQQNKQQLPRVHRHDQFVDAEWDSAADLNYRHSYDGSIPPGKVRTLSSHSHSQGDSEEWEDCTESSGALEDDSLSDGILQQQHLHLECQLNPEAPEFLPTSPDFLKTPPGHVKVLNWAGSNSPTSPQSNLSQPGLLSMQSPRSPRQPQQQQQKDSESSFSSPGSSASTRAKNRREEMDTMPEPDEPLPPPFLLNAEMSPVAMAVEMDDDDDDDEDEDEDDYDDKAGAVLENGDKSIDNEADDEGDDDDDDDDNERFEDSVEVPDVGSKESKADSASTDESLTKREAPSSQDGNLKESVSISVADDAPSPQSTVNNDKPVNNENFDDKEAKASKSDCGGEGEDLATATDTLAPESSKPIEVTMTNDEVKRDQSDSLSEVVANNEGVEGHQGAEDKEVEVLQGAEDKEVEVHQGAEDKEVEVHQGAEDKEVEGHQGAEDKEVEVHQGAEDKEVEGHQGAEDKEVEVHQGAEDKEVEGHQGAEDKEVEVHHGAEDKEVEVHHGAEDKEVEAHQGAEDKEDGTDTVDADQPTPSAIDPETLDDSKVKENGKAADANGAINAESTTDSTQESTTDSTQESTTDSTQESTTDSTQESTTDSTQESKTDSTQESKTDSTQESKTDSTQESKTDSTQESNEADSQPQPTAENSASS